MVYAVLIFVVLCLLVPGLLGRALLLVLAVFLLSLAHVLGQQ